MVPPSGGPDNDLGDTLSWQVTTIDLPSQFVQLLQDVVDVHTAWIQYSAGKL
jgi:hypothetical protein